MIPKNIAEKIEAWAATCFPPKGEPNYSDLLRDEYISDMTKGAELALESAWVSVDDALPEMLGEVLCCRPSKHTWVQFIGYRNMGCWYIIDDERALYPEFEPTHWQPLPTPPNTTP